jgi:hypothetical protein
MRTFCAEAALCLSTGVAPRNYERAPRSQRNDLRARYAATWSSKAHHQRPRAPLPVTSVQRLLAALGFLSSTSWKVSGTINHAR